MSNIWRAIRFIPEYRGRIAGIFLVGAVLAAIGTAIPYLFKHLVDVIAGLLAGRITHADAAARALLLVAIFVGLRLLLVVFAALQDKQSDDLWLETVSTFRQRVFDNMTRLSMDYFEHTRTGEILDRFGTITQITMWLFSLTEGVLANAIQLLFILVALTVKAPLAGLMMIAVVIANLLVSRHTIKTTAPYRRGWQKLAGRMTGLLGEMVANISTVRSFGGEAAMKQRYDDTQAEWKITRGTLHQLEWRTNFTLSLINGAGVCVVVATTAMGALRGGLSAGDMLFILTLTNIVFSTIAPIARQFNQGGTSRARPSASSLCWKWRRKLRTRRMRSIWRTSLRSPSMRSGSAIRERRAGRCAESVSTWRRASRLRSSVAAAAANRPSSSC